MAPFSILKNLRWCTVIMGLSNLIVIILGGILIEPVYSVCGHKDVVPFTVILLGACLRISIMIRTAIAQQAAATMILKPPSQSAVFDAVVRHERRIRYKRWLWWTRFLMLTTVLQFVATAILMLIVAKHLRQVGASSNCVLGHVSNGTKWQQNILVLFIIVVVYVATVQCLIGSDVLTWRSFYETEDNAWKSHYSEVFDYGMREALCCLGRFKYLSVSDEDEVYSVAKLLGDLVAYRAAGTGHLELLAGLALLQRHSQSPILYEGYMEAPEEHIQEAIDFHPFSQAAYTGLLLDIGRNPLLFPCSWLHRQGILTPWTRNRRPVLEGDNWWRGHAAAFLKYVNLSPEALRKGRVNQAKCEAAYFITVLRHLKAVVITVRGTETPEDLITDGLCNECTLSAEDLDGLINGNHVHSDVRQRVIASIPHYGHSGIVEAARDLFMRIEGNPEDDGCANISSESRGFLSSLLGAGCECDGYGVRIVGHSLGGAIAAFLGLRLYGRFPNLHVYAYGPLPCLDPVIADACSEFVTSIVYNNEFSSRLSVASVLRLRAAALTAVSQDTADSTITSRLARRFLFVSKCERSAADERVQSSHLISTDMAAEDRNLRVQCRNGSREQDKEFPLFQYAGVEDAYDNKVNQSDSAVDFTNPFCASPSNLVLSGDPVTEFVEVVTSENGPAGNLPEMYLPGLVIHVVPQKNSFAMPLGLWSSFIMQEKYWSYKAYVANREAFKDIIVSPSMFLDHFPWRCDYAMRSVLESRSAQILNDGSQTV